MTLQTPDTRPAPRWKVLVIASASAGAGFALILAGVVGSALWYGSRPRPPKPWNTRAVRARYSHATVEDADCFMPKSEPARKTCEGANGQVLLAFELQNATDYDYRLEDQSNLEIMERREKVLSPRLQHQGTFWNGVTKKFEVTKDVSISKLKAAHPEISSGRAEKDIAALKAGGELPKYLYDGLVVPDNQLFWTVQTPVFVPAQQTVAVDVKGPYTCRGCGADELKSVVKDIPELVLFDPSTRYEIEFPKPRP